MALWLSEVLWRSKSLQQVWAHQKISCLVVDIAGIARGLSPTPANVLSLSADLSVEFVHRAVDVILDVPGFSRCQIGTRFQNRRPDVFGIVALLGHALTDRPVGQ